MLFLGDLVFIPDPRQNPVARPTDKHHRFVMRGVPSIVRIRLRDELDRPRKGIAYDFRVGDDRRSGTTDDNGELKEPVSPADVEAFLAFGEGDARQEVCLRIGNLDPVEEVSGMQARLANLGLNVGDVDGILGPVTTSALSDFQVQVGLEPTGEADEATRAKLTNLHGC